MIPYYHLSHPDSPSETFFLCISSILFAEILRMKRTFFSICMVWNDQPGNQVKYSWIMVKSRVYLLHYGWTFFVPKPDIWWTIFAQLGSMCWISDQNRDWICKRLTLNILSVDSLTYYLVERCWTSTVEQACSQQGKWVDKDIKWPIARVWIKTTYHVLNGGLI